MTENEAKTKWCPMVRIGDMNMPTGINRSNLHSTHCMGSDCMMWRWRDSRDMPPSPDPAVPRERFGFCGLAGSYFCES